MDQSTIESENTSLVFSSNTNTDHFCPNSRPVVSQVLPDGARLLPNDIQSNYNCRPLTPSAPPQEECIRIKNERIKTYGSSKDELEKFLRKHLKKDEYKGMLNLDENILCKSRKRKPKMDTQETNTPMKMFDLDEFIALNIKLFEVSVKVNKEIHLDELEDGCYLLEIWDTRPHLKHCMAMLKQNIKISFFDSLCQEPPKNLKIKITERNPHQLQHSDNKTCGLHCLYFLVNLSQGLTMPETLQSYPNTGNLHDNDDHVISFYTQNTL